MEGLYTGKGHGQIVTCSLLSSFPVGDRTKTNTNKTYRRNWSKFLILYLRTEHWSSEKNPKALTR